MKPHRDYELRISNDFKVSQKLFVENSKYKAVHIKVFRSEIFHDSKDKKKVHNLAAQVRLALAA